MILVQRNFNYDKKVKEKINKTLEASFIIRIEETL